MNARDVFIKILKVYFASCIVLSLSFNSWSQQKRAPQPKRMSEMPREAYEKAAPVTVKISCDRGEKTGSGSIVAYSGRGFALILTACHVVASNFEETDPNIPLEFHKDIQVKISSQLGTERAYVVKNCVDRENDLALIGTKSAVPERRMISYTPSDKIKPGEKVAALGFPQTDRLRSTVGRVTQLENKYLVFDAAIKQGSSGGPLIDKKGRMIGLTNFLVRDEEGQGYALHMNLIVSVVEGWLKGIRLRDKWQLEKDGSFITNPWFIGGMIVTAGGGAFAILSGGGPPEEGFPLPPGRPGGN